MAITWNPQSYRIVRLEVRDSTGDLVGKVPCLYSVLQRLFTLLVMWSVYTKCAATVIFSSCSYSPWHSQYSQYSFFGVHYCSSCGHLRGDSLRGRSWWRWNKEFQWISYVHHQTRLTEHSPVCTHSPITVATCNFMHMHLFSCQVQTMLHTNSELLHFQLMEEYLCASVLPTRMSAICAKMTVAPRCHVSCAIQCLFRLADSVPYIYYSSDSLTILCVHHRHWSWLCKLQPW